MSAKRIGPFPDLSPGKHLLLDHATIADTYRLKRRIHQPKREPTDPVLTHEKPWEGDSIAHKLSWRGKSDLGALRGRRLMLRMSLYHADIYSFTL